MQQVQPVTEQPSERVQSTIAMVLGQPSYNDIDWRKLMQKCILVSLMIGRCRFTAKLELADLGITIQDAQALQMLQKNVLLGSKRLIPEEYIKPVQQLESEARRSLKQKSFNFGKNKFMPKALYDVWKAEMERYEGRYQSLRDTIIENHETICTTMVAEYQIVARDTYSRLRETSPQLLQESREEFVERYCNNILAQIPSVQKIRDTFQFRTQIDDPLAQIEGLETLPAGRQDERPSGGWRLSTLEQDLIQQAMKQKQELVDGFLTTIVAQVRTTIYEATGAVLTSLKKRQDGKFPPRSVTQLKNLVAQVSQLNFYEDREIDIMLQRLQEIVDESPQQRNRSVEEIEKKLRAIGVVTRKTLRDLAGENAREGRDFSLDLPELTMGLDVREARMELGLETINFAGISALAEREQRQERESPVSIASLFSANFSERSGRL